MKRGFCIAAVWATVAFATPSRFVVRSWGIEAGLPQSSVTGIAQDHRGFLWLSTFGGLMRFDGRHFERIDARTDDFDGLRFVSVACQGDALWAGTEDGRLFRFDALGTRPPVEVPLPTTGFHDPLWELHVTDDGLLVAAGRAGVLRVTRGEARQVDPRTARTVFVDGQGRLWSGATTEVRCVSGACPAPIHTPHVLASARADGAALELSGASATVRVEEDGTQVLLPHVRSRLHDPKTGVRWVALDDALAVEHDGVAETLELPRGVERPSIRVLFLDDRGVLWLGTDGNGLLAASDRGTRVVSAPGAGSNRSFTTVMAEPEGGALVAGYCQGLFRYLPAAQGGPKLERVEGIAPADCIATLARTGDGRVLFVGSSHIGRLEPGQPPRALLTLEEGLVTNTMRLEGATAWLGTNAGLLEVDLTTPAQVVRRWTVADGLSDDRVFSLARAATGELLVGTGRGLSRLVDGRIEPGWTEGSARPVAVRDILVEPDGALWLATYGGGLAFTTPGAPAPWNVRWLDRAAGFCGDELSTVLPDGQELWFNGNQGSFRVHKAALVAYRGGAAAPACERFETGEGNGGVQPAGAVLTDGTLAFPTVFGLALVDPAHTSPEDATPVYLSHARVDDTPLGTEGVTTVPVGRRALMVSLAVPHADPGFEPTLEHALIRGDDVLRRRDGLETHWDHLPPGDYVYEARRIGRDGSRGAPLVLRFRLEPSWLERPVVQLGLPALVLLAVLLAARGWTRTTRARAEALERQLAESARAEAARRERDAVQHALFQSSPAPLLLFSGHRITELNAAAERLLGVKQGDAPCFVGDTERLIFQAMLDATAKGTQQPPRELEGMRADGEPCVLRAEMVLLPRGDTHCVLVALTNLSAEREEAERRQQLLERTAVAQRLEGLGRLAAGVAHDFNNVLAALTMQVADLEATGNTAHLVPEMKDALQMGRDLTRRFLVFGRGDPELGALPLDQALEQSRPVLERLFPRGVTLALHTGAEGRSVSFSRPLLDQLLLNLVVNARDAVGPRGHVRLVSTPEASPTEGLLQVLPRPDGEVVELRVEDDGMGMDAQTQARAFEPFFTTKAAQGTGVGLTVVLGIARGARAGLAVRSSPGQGTTVVVQLRVVSQTPAPVTGPAQHSTAPVVLICDDLAPLRAAVGRSFRREGFEVLEASDGLEALALLETRRVSVVLTDLNMPRLDGVGLVEAIRQRGLQVPILMLTGFAADAWTRLPAKYHASIAVLEKPIEPQDLVAAARGVLQG